MLNHGQYQIFHTNTKDRYRVILIDNRVIEVETDPLSEVSPISQVIKKVVKESDNAQNTFRPNYTTD
tara:strand:+ start:1365 stop:1565 length:201 start_codon:yes stop_codon:yes gene_type:complete